MRWRTQIGQVGSIGHEIGDDLVIQPLEGSQGLGQRGLGMSHPDAALRATGVRHIYLILSVIYSVSVVDYR